MNNQQPATLAVAKEGRDAQYFRASEAGLWHFSFVDFWQARPLLLKMGEMESAQFTDLKPYPQERGKQILNREKYLKTAEQAIDMLRSGALAKVVLSRKEFIPAHVSSIDLFHALRDAYPQATVYCFQHPDAGTWLGASPEVLLDKKGEQLSTMSLAGTKAADAETEFGSKEKEEQQLVTDYIVNTLNSQTELSQVETGERQEILAGPVKHLRTAILASCEKNWRPEQLLAALHPTPAVCGLPLKEAKAFIAQVEAHDREYYCGYFGLRAQDDFFYRVNLRCARLFADGVELFAGGGLTADSEPLAEWQETEVKMQTIRNMLKL